ncbi:alpha/beta hydrolase, partial [Dysgonomonas gadei]|uniref:alpha/beta hydrolase n=1 Tax=Dysgonomonas gadei TaxID=156974 RepID=UPI003AF19D50
MSNSPYKEDILKDRFEAQTLKLRDDYEGMVTATLIRRLPESKSNKAVLYIHGFNDYFFQTEMACRFNDHGFNFYAIDLRKYGRSFLPHQKFNDIRNLKDYYEEILQSLDIIRSEG